MTLEAARETALSRNSTLNQYMRAYIVLTDEGKGRDDAAYRELALVRCQTFREYYSPTY